MVLGPIVRVASDTGVVAAGSGIGVHYIPVVVVGAVAVVAGDIVVAHEFAVVAVEVANVVVGADDVVVGGCLALAFACPGAEPGAGLRFVVDFAGYDTVAQVVGMQYPVKMG